MFEVQEESFCDNLGELEPLFDVHYSEISRHARRGIILSPDYERYGLLEANNELLFITLRYNKSLVGYVNCVVGRPLHYDIIQQMLDLIYVLPNFRGTGHDGQNGGDMLILKAMELGKARGAKCFTAGAKAKALPHFKKLLEKHLFEPFEFHYIHWYD